MVIVMQEGATDAQIQHVIDRLVASGFNGPAAYEMCSPLRGGGGIENLDSCARRFIEYMRKLDVCAPRRVSEAVG